MKKEIIILNGGGHKGIVKISAVTGKDDTAKVECTLDFMPRDAVLYIIGDNVAQIALNGTKCTVEVPFYASGASCCVVKSTALTLFGGEGAKSDMLRRIDVYNRELKRMKNEHESELKRLNADKAAKEGKAASETNLKCKVDEGTRECNCEHSDCGEGGCGQTDGGSDCGHKSCEQEKRSCGSKDGTDCDLNFNRCRREVDNGGGENRNDFSENAETHYDCPSDSCDLKDRMKSDDKSAQGDFARENSQHVQGASCQSAEEAAKKFDTASLLGEWTKYDGNNFYYAVKPQIDELFVCYPEEKNLSEGVPNSKWVRVDAEDGYYVVGLLFDEDEPSFICYGVPEYLDADKRRAPQELENMCVFLPLDFSEGERKATGYWVIYQSAKTGEIIK